MRPSSNDPRPSVCTSFPTPCRCYRSTPHPPTSPCCTDKAPDLLRSFALFTLVPFSSSPLYCQGSIHWLSCWVQVRGGQHCFPPLGPRQLGLCPAVPPGPSPSFFSPNLAAEEVEIPQLHPKTSSGTLCLKICFLFLLLRKGLLKKKNGMFLTAFLWFLFPKPSFFS